MDLDRKLVRYVGAGISLVMALIYYLIGAGAITVVTPTPAGDSMLVFGLLAGSAFATGAALLAMYDVRILWIVGLLFQVFVVFTYFAVAPQRDPQFEVWGITLLLIQIPLTVALAYLTFRPQHTVRRAMAMRVGGRP